ncbi:MAG: hydantoinase/oxoprolinase family protein [Haloarculaceae archaeon]
MIVGIDTGGTNVDAALVDDGIVASAKVPGDDPDPIERVLDRLPGESTDIDRVVVATTLVVNAAVQNRLPACTNVLVPGPGLSPELAFHGEENHVAEGCVDHRGRVTEEPAYEGEPDGDVVAVTAKFGTRNPDPECEIAESIAREVALGQASGPGLTFPERAATTVANAKARPTFAGFAADVAGALDATGIDAPVYYLKGDAAMLSADAMRSTPAHALRAGAAASTLGLIALSGVDEAVCVDVGGTTTDVTRVDGGFPATEPVSAGDLETGYRGVRAISLPLGGDTRVDGDGLTERRAGNAAAFGGEAPTLTDAFHVTGTLDERVGDPEAARSAFERFDEPTDLAGSVVETYVDRVARAVETVGPDATALVAGGVLGPRFAERIADTTPGVDEVHVPQHAPVAGAVGCAVARVSVETQIRVDSARGEMTVSAIGTRTERVKQGRTFGDKEIERLAVDSAREAARDAGAPHGDTPVEVLESRQFNVVEKSRVDGQIVDVTAQIEPALRHHFWSEL